MTEITSVCAGARGPIVGSRVTLEPYAISGIVVDLVLDSACGDLAFAVVSFDSGLDQPPLYQPIRWHLLRFAGCAEGYVVNAGDDALSDIPEALKPNALHYGHNSSQRTTLPPVPQSSRLH